MWFLKTTVLPVLIKGQRIIMKGRDKHINKVLGSLVWTKYKQSTEFMQTECIHSLAFFPRSQEMTQ